MDTVESNNEIINKTKVKQMNTCLYFFEALACCLIVFAHCKFPGDFGILMTSLMKFGVPLFFAISGFFLFNVNSTKEETRFKLKKRAIRILILLLFSFSIYFVIGAIQSCTGSTAISFGEYLKSTFYWKKIFALLIFNSPLTNVINWFMIALLFSYFIIYLFPNLFLKNDLFLSIVSGLTIFWIVFRIIVLITKAHLFGFDLSQDYLYRSWYASGLLFVCFGILIKKKEGLINKISTKMIVLFLFLSLMIMVAENFLIMKLLKNSVSYSFGSLGCVFFMLALSMKNPNLFSKSKILNMKGNWTSYVYIFHPAIIVTLSALLTTLGISGSLIDWFKPIIVLVLSLITAIAFNLFVEFIKPKIKGTNNT